MIGIVYHTKFTVEGGRRPRLTLKRPLRAFQSLSFATPDFTVVGFGMLRAAHNRRLHRLASQWKPYFLTAVSHTSKADNSILLLP
jgi:hypothetical protein